MEYKKVSVFRSWFLILFFLFIVFAICGCNEAIMGSRTNDDISLEQYRPDAVRIIRQGLKDPNPRTMSAAVEVVATTRQIVLMPQVQKLLRDDVVSVRFAAALAVGDMEYHLAKKELIRLLTDSDENVRIAAAYAMAKLGSARHFELVRKAITSTNQQVRANAALLLGKSGDRQAIKLLYRAMLDKTSSEQVIFMAAEARAMLGDERIYPKLWAMLINIYADDRVIGVRAMGALGTPQARNAILTMLDDDIPEVRLTAAEQLGRLGETTGEAEVIELFEKKRISGLEKQEVERINVLAALAIGQIGTAKITGFLPDLLENESKLVNIAAAKAVLQCIKRGAWQTKNR